MSHASAGDLGVYLHVPFCERICPYCDFAVVAARPLEPARERRYVDALLAELQLRAEPLREASLATIYFGGGTPALLEPASIGRLIEAVRNAFPLAPQPRVEVTLETNPSTLERSRLHGFREAGVDRLSLGVQSFDDGVLKRLGRAHRAADSHAVLAAARGAGFERISLDLIFGGPATSLAQLDRDLDETLRHAPEHVSSYELTVEPGTPFALADARGQLERADDDLAIAMMDRIEQRLATAGLERYEQSSFARAGAEARHNRRYWLRERVLGLGMGAWSYFPPRRAHPAERTSATTGSAGPGSTPYGVREGNERQLAAYLERIEAGELATAERDVLERATAQREALMLGLRQREGVDLAAFEAEFGTPLARICDEAALAACLREGLLVEAGRRLGCSTRGRTIADEIVARLL